MEILFFAPRTGPWERTYVFSIDETDNAAVNSSQTIRLAIHVGTPPSLQEGNKIWKPLELFIHVREPVALEQASGTADGIVCNRSRPVVCDLRWRGNYIPGFAMFQLCRLIFSLPSGPQKLVSSVGRA